jgi:UDP-hydrolysing UDP-N-acetyl-D-glucosamine 2-epimerase
MQIPIIHLQGGEISGTIDDKIRDTNSKLADLHLTTNETSRRRIISLGEPEELIHIIGCPSIDIVKRVIETGHQPNWYSMDGVGCAIDQHDEFGIIMFHPDTLNIVESLEWVDLLIRLVERSSIKWFWFWPNPDHGSDKVSKILRKSREIGKLKNVRFVINLSPEDFIAVALYSSIFLGNSSFGIRESGYMGLPSITTGQRQRGRDKSLNVQSIEEPQFEVLMDVFNQLLGKKFAKSTLYGDGNSGRLGAEIISTWNPRPKVRKIYH